LLDTGLLPGRLGCESTGSEPWSGPVAPMTGGRAAPAVRSDVDASVRQDVGQQTTHQRFGRAGTAWGLRSGRCLVLTSDWAIRQREEALLADGHANDRRSQRAEGVLATADWRTGHAPVLLPYGLLAVSAQGGVVPVVSARGLADDGAGLDVDAAVCA